MPSFSTTCGLIVNPHSSTETWKDLTEQLQGRRTAPGQREIGVGAGTGSRSPKAVRSLGFEECLQVHLESQFALKKKKKKVLHSTAIAETASHLFRGKNRKFLSGLVERLQGILVSEIL